MSVYTLRGVTAGLMILATTTLYAMALVSCGAELGLRLYHVGYLEPPRETLEALVIAVGRPALGWLVVMSVVFPLWATSQADSSSFPSMRQSE